MTANVLILDFGSQVTQLIARRVRENGVYCEIHPFNKADEAIAQLAPAAIILSGGPASVTADDGPACPALCSVSAFPSSVYVTASKACALSWAGRSILGRARVRPRRA